MCAFKILVTSQKGGVGKSTLAANLAVYFARQHEVVTLLDFDTQGSSSHWLLRAPSQGVVIQHHCLPWDQGGNRPLMDARLHLRRAQASCDVVICDLTWADSMADEYLFEFDAVIVPTSVAEIELAATAGFLNKRRWVFDSHTKDSPDLLLCPSRVNWQQHDSHAFTQQRFAVSFLLSPPVLESSKARDSFENAYLLDLQNECADSFKEFCRAVNVTRELRMSRLALNAFGHERAETTHKTSGARRPKTSQASGHGRQQVMSRLVGNSAVLGRHYVHKKQMLSAPPSALPAYKPNSHFQSQAQGQTTKVSSAAMIRNGFGRLLKRFSLMS